LYDYFASANFFKEKNMFCTIQNIKNLVPQNLLTELTSGNDDVIARAIESASATVKAYLSGSYELSKVADSEFLRTIAERIAVYNIYMVSASDETPQIVITSYLEAISDLGKIQSGTVSLFDAKDTPNTRLSEVLTNKSAADKEFSKENLGGF
jgi:phage gp36-like protein